MKWYILFLADICYPSKSWHRHFNIIKNVLNCELIKPVSLHVKNLDIMYKSFVVKGIRLIRICIKKQTNVPWLSMYAILYTPLWVRKSCIVSFGSHANYAVPDETILSAPCAEEEVV